MHIDRDIRHNENLLTNEVAFLGFPSLRKYLFNRNSRLRADLLEYLSHMESTKPDTIYAKRPYWIIPIEQMLNSKHRGTRETWQSHLVFLTKTGLLQRIKPNKHTLNKDMKRVYDNSRAAKREPPIFYSVRRWTAERLSKAESVAEVFSAMGISVSHIRKVDFVYAFGQVEADLYYQDQRGMTEIEREAREDLLQEILHQISTRGYAVKDEAIKTVICKKAQEIPEVALTQYRRKLSYVAHQIKSFCAQNGLEHRKVRLSDHESRGLAYGKSIITDKKLCDNTDM